jgi:pimeloyl-ACP methyl ester carboxylesterase
MSAIIIENGLVHYEALGRGRPLIFIHGWLGSWRYWVSAMDDLSDGYRTYALDLWGFGDSDRRKEGYSLTSYIALVQKFMDELGIWRAPLVGHALGGVVALHFAATHPERVEQVMAVSIPLDGSAVSRSLASFTGHDRDVVGRILGRRNLSAYPEVSQEAGKIDGFAVANSVQAVLGANLEEVLQAVEVPVLLVHGRNDPVIHPPDEARLDGFDGNVRIIALDGARHFPMLEEANRFNRLLRAFLETGGDLQALELKEEWRRRWR